MVEKAKHVGFPLPSEMFHDSEVTKREDFTKHSAICVLLDIDLTCPYCKEILIKANERREQKQKQ